MYGDWKRRGVRVEKEKKNLLGRGLERSTFQEEGIAKKKEDFFKARPLDL